MHEHWSTPKSLSRVSQEVPTKSKAWENSRQRQIPLLGRSSECPSHPDSLSLKDHWLRNSLMNLKSVYRLSLTTLKLLRCTLSLRSQTSSRTPPSPTNCVWTNTSPTAPLKRPHLEAVPCYTKLKTGNRLRIRYTTEFMTRVNAHLLNVLRTTKTMIRSILLKWPCSEIMTSSILTWVQMETRAIPSCKSSREFCWLAFFLFCCLLSMILTKLIAFVFRNSTMPFCPRHQMINTMQPGQPD